MKAATDQYLRRQVSIAAWLIGGEYSNRLAAYMGLMNVAMPNAIDMHGDCFRNCCTNAAE